MKLLLLQTGIRPGAFVRTSLHVDSYASLMIGRDSYESFVLRQLPYLADARVLHVASALRGPKDVFDRIAQCGIDVTGIHPDSAIIYLDLRYCVTDGVALDRIIEKAHYVEKVVSMVRRMPHRDHSIVAVVKTTHHSVVANAGIERWAGCRGFDDHQVDVTDFTIDMEDAASALDLFARSLDVRVFNHIRSEGRYFRKSSTDKAKMAAEHRFLRAVPPEVQPYFPHVGEFREEGERASYQVERVFMFDAGKMLINGVFAARATLAPFLDRLRAYLHACPTREIGAAEFHREMLRLFVDKLGERLEQTRKLTVFGRLDEICRLESFSSFEDLTRQVQNAIRAEIEKMRDTRLVFSHGDLCLPNILYDTNTTQLKLIDPRGCGEDGDAWMPRYYDLAKLSHSFLGLYEVLVCARFDLELDENLRIVLRHRLPGGTVDLLRDEFSQFLAQLDCPLARVRLLEASLFISMIPLHYDSSRRMAAELLQGIRSFRAARD
jgi:hypothetical protein